MNWYRSFIVFSIGYAVGSLAMAALDMGSRVNSVVSLVFLVIASFMYMSRKDSNEEENLMLAFRKGMDYYKKNGEGYEGKR